MYLVASSKMMKYYTETCGITIKPRSDEDSFTGGIHNIILNRPGEPVFLGITTVEQNMRAMLFTKTILSYNNRKKSRGEQMALLETIARGFVKYATNNDKNVLTIATDNEMLLEIMVDMSFILISPEWKNESIYKGVMPLDGTTLLPF